MARDETSLIIMGLVTGWVQTIKIIFCARAAPPVGIVKLKLAVSLRSIRLHCSLKYLYNVTNPNRLSNAALNLRFISNNFIP